MKEAIHPDYKPAKVVCACGNVIETRSTRGDFHIEICAAVPPVLHGQAEDHGHRGPHREVQEPLRRDPGRPRPAPKKAEAKAEPAKKAEAPKENRAAKRAKSGKAKPKTEAAPAEPAAEAKGE